MKSILLIAILSCFVASSYAGGKTKLFNGKNLKNWELVVKDNAADPSTVFSVEDGVIKVTGVPQGYLRTKEVYTNYKLHVEWRWTEEPSNSGVLVHVNGYDHWPNCIEAQLMNQKAGDLVFIGYGSSGIVGDSTFLNLKGRYSIAAKQNESNEVTPGKWNTYDIICDSDEITLYVNGELQNKGIKLSHTGGSIALQSEGSPIEFRNIYLTELED